MPKPNVNLMFRAFSDRTRLRILHLLLNSELCVCDIVTVIRVPQPTASRHLAYLLRAGLIAKRKEGLWAYYKLAPASSSFHRSLIQCLKECFRDVLELASDAKRASKANICCVPAKGNRHEAQGLVSLHR
jgi:ArsR family transcriptional regulator, arsenate/arsenite/antimonite-responsive transcriptional repressor